jgi:surface polysaccharide O-acyltransferase-like enzyme
VDLVKTVAIGDVILSHVAVPAFSAGAVGTPAWLCALFWASITHVSVSLFLMASGTLLLDPDRPLTLRKLYTKNFPRLLAALLFWAACYKLFGLLLWRQLSAASLLQAAKEVVLFRHEEHLYYLHIMLLVYAFLPVTRLVARHASRRQLQYLLGLWFLLGILYPTVKPYWPFTLLVGIPTQWLMNMTYASIGYTLLGYYLSVYRGGSRRRPWLLTAIAGFLVTFGGSWAASAMEGKLNTHFIEGMGVGVCLLAVGIYGLCLSAPIPERLGKGLTWISNASFCVFLVHIFFLKTFARFGLTALAGPAIVSIPLVSLLILACGCGTWWVLSRVPVVKNWLI